MQDVQKIATRLGSLEAAWAKTNRKVTSDRTRGQFPFYPFASWCTVISSGDVRLLMLLARDVFDAFASSWREDMVRQKAPGWWQLVVDFFCFFVFVQCRFKKIIPSPQYSPPLLVPTCMWKFCTKPWFLDSGGRDFFYSCVCLSVVPVYPCSSCIIRFIQLHSWDEPFLKTMDASCRFNSFVEASLRWFGAES